MGTGKYIVFFHVGRITFVTAKNFLIRGLSYPAVSWTRIHIFVNLSPFLNFYRLRYRVILIKGKKIFPWHSCWKGMNGHIFCNLGKYFVTSKKVKYSKNVNSYIFFSLLNSKHVWRCWCVSYFHKTNNKCEVWFAWLEKPLLTRHYGKNVRF